MATITLGSLYNKLVEAVYTDDMSSQRYYLSMIEDQRHISVDYLIERGCLFIPNNDYIYYYLGKEAYAYGTGLYIEDRCMWTLYAVIPIQDLSGDVVGLVGWDAQNKYLELTEGQKGLSMYKVTSKKIFPKDRYFLTDINVLKKTFQERTIFVVDGVFDSVALNYRGIPAISLLGSTFSREVLYFLRWYKAVYVVCDNDSAGSVLLTRLKHALPNVYRVSQGICKDIEEALRPDGMEGNLTLQLKNISEECPMHDIVLKG